MKQLALGIGIASDLGLQESVMGGNAELHQALRAILHGTASERHVYVWGARGSGRSHMLRAVAVDAGRRRLAAHWWPFEADAGDREGIDLVDDVDRLDSAGQIDLFHAFNRAHESGRPMILTGPVAPASLSLRPDLRTRLGACLVFQLQALADEDKVEALRVHARARGLELPADVATYLLTRSDRDLSALLGVLDLLDKGSLEQKRPLTVPLLRQVLGAP
jgi:DnaA family protein